MVLVSRTSGAIREIAIKSDIIIMSDKSMNEFLDIHNLVHSPIIGMNNIYMIKMGRSHIDLKK